MRIVVDLNRCLGYAQCVPLAPEVLQLQGEEALAYDPNPDDSQRQRVARACRSVPRQPQRGGAGPVRPAMDAERVDRLQARDQDHEDSQRQRVARAVASCPVQAIIAEMDPPSDRTTK